jgi:hypothetical protein
MSIKGREAEFALRRLMAKKLKEAERRIERGPWAYGPYGILGNRRRPAKLTAARDDRR